jgi:hypothetical protein
VPNYALLQDQRYRRVWRAYREILRNFDEQDECWRWQHRLWADYCRLLVQVALHATPKFHAIAESPLRIAPEQRRGRWSLVDAHSGTYLVYDNDDEPAAVISVLWDTTLRHSKLAPWMAGLGAAAVLHLQSLENGRESYLLLWPLHLFGDEAPSLHQIAASGQRALGTSLSLLALADDVNIRAEGLVLVSNFGAWQTDSEMTAERDGTVVAARLSARYGDLRRDVERLGSWLHSMSLRLVKTTAAT